MGLMGKLEIIGLLSIINHLPSPAKIDNSDTQHNWRVLFCGGQSS
jgi:hypothetical protein